MAYSYLYVLKYETITIHNSHVCKPQVENMNEIVPLQAEIDELSKYAKSMGGTAQYLPTSKIVISEFAALKCRYGCRGYGKRFSCPPNATTPEETRKILAEYQHAIMFRFTERDGFLGYTSPPGNPETTAAWVHRSMLALERHAFMAGYYKAFSFSAHPCSVCTRCAIKDGGTICRYRDQVRPSMEGCGIDVYATAKSIGWIIETLAYMSDGKSTYIAPHTHTLILLE
jgi:predicted metal-binding protein